jgi:DeoR/GlpR family transcriptional regulator of sugar metabolism
MLARHRQSLILEEIRRAGSARVSDLTQRLGVSDMTIRRDLEALARAGLIEKVHGGAVLPGSPSSHEPGFEAKSVLEKPQKEAIARAAAELVTPGTAIALSAGTTTFALAQQLLDVSGLTIVTNSVRVASIFGVPRPGHSAPPRRSCSPAGSAPPRMRWSARSRTSRSGPCTWTCSSWAAMASIRWPA